MQQHWLEGDELKPQVTRRVAFLGGSEKPLQDNHRFWDVPVLQHMIVGPESPDNGMCCESPRGFSLIPRNYFFDVAFFLELLLRLALEWRDQGALAAIWIFHLGQLLG